MLHYHANDNVYAIQLKKLLIVSPLCPFWK